MQKPQQTLARLYTIGCLTYDNPLQSIVLDLDQIRLQSDTDINQTAVGLAFDRQPIANRK